MVGVLLSGMVSFALAVALGKPLIAELRRRGLGKNIRVDGPASHSAKTGTPTMGGLMILGPVVVLTVTTNLAGRQSMLLPLAVMLGFAALGLYDDWTGLHDRTGVGMLARLKFPWQVLIGVAAAITLRVYLGIGLTAVPGLDRAVDIGWLYIPVAVFLIVGVANAVNLTDGLDGLAGGTSAVAFLAYGVIALAQQQSYVAAFCFTVAGAVLGFLWYNVNPAQVFMGDVGALGLGAALATVALMTGQWPLLLVIGGLFALETVSVMLQVGYFKATRGRRLFKMAPFHHHLELSGWKEVQITQRFWVLAVVLAMAGVALALW